MALAVEKWGYATSSNSAGIWLQHTVIERVEWGEGGFKWVFLEIKCEERGIVVSARRSTGSTQQKLG